MKCAILIAIVLAFALVCVVDARSSKDSCNGKDYGTAGQFDYYVYAQSWPAEFCSSHSSFPGCSSQVTSWQQVNLTLHGMWPNYDESQNGHAWPQCCPSSYGSALDVQVAESLMSQLATYWPNEQDPSFSSPSTSLWAHEWNKHGTCSGLSQNDYFQTAMSIELSMPTPAAIMNNVGGQVALSALQSAYGTTDCQQGGDCTFAFQCTGSSGSQYLSGVTSCRDQKFNQIQCPQASLSSQGQQCTDSTINIRSFSSSVEQS